MSNKPNWPRLIRGLIMREWDASEEFVRVATTIISVVARRYGLNEDQAKDLAQNIFLKLTEDNFRRLREFDTTRDTSFSSYLRTVTVNRTIEDWKSRSARNSRATSSFDDISPILEEQPKADRELALRDLWEGLDRLSVRRKRVIILYAVEGWSYKEIANDLGIGVGGVGALIFRIRVELKEILRGTHADLDCEAADAVPPHAPGDEQAR